MLLLAAASLAAATPACERLNVERNTDLDRTHEITKAVLCDARPTPCVTEMLFAHELYWSETRAAKRGGIKCARWARDEDWPTRDPHLTRTPRSTGLWASVLRHMPNRTLWLHGDSITTQACEAALCSLVRERVVRQPPLCTFSGRHPSSLACPDIDALSRRTGMQIRAAILPNGARLMCSAVGVYEPEKVAAVLEHADVALVNYGLHYHIREGYVAMLDHLFGLMRRWASAPGRGRVPLFRELSAQHFRGGAWAPGADKPKPGTPCECEPLRTRGALSRDERTSANQNVAFNAAAATTSARHGIGIVPFYNLTAPRFDMHRRHFCSYANRKASSSGACEASARKVSAGNAIKPDKQCGVGRCCDCTHLCYTPLFWDVFFADLRDTLLAHPRFAGVGGGPIAPGAVRVGRDGQKHGRRRGRGRGRGRGGARGRGRGRGRWRPSGGPGRPRAATSSARESSRTAALSPESSS